MMKEGEDIHASSSKEKTAEPQSAS